MFVTLQWKWTRNGAMIIIYPIDRSHRRTKMRGQLLRILEFNRRGDDIHPLRRSRILHQHLSRIDIPVSHAGCQQTWRKKFRNLQYGDK